jgi:hypothetical protein
MKWLHILILGVFLSLPLAGNAVVHFPSTDITSYQIEKTKKKEKPRKRFKRWLRKHPGKLILGGFSVAGISMFILGVIWKMRWLWMTGLFTVLTPWIFIFIIILLYLIFRPQYTRPPMLEDDPIPQEKTEEEKKKDTK